MIFFLFCSSPVSNFPNQKYVMGEYQIGEMKDSSELLKRKERPLLIYRNFVDVFVSRKGDKLYFIFVLVSTFHMSNRMMHENVVGQRMKSFNFIKQLGSGAWAVVYECYDERTNSTVAIKAIPRILMKQTPKLEELVKTEINVLKECHNENVIRYVDSFSNEKTQFIAMEYCNGGDLEVYLERKKRLTEDEATTFLKQIINGFKGLHEVNAMHRDFKVANVLLHDGCCKIADLGFAKQFQKKKMTGTILGTSLTMAPELLREQKYGLEADIWSVGVVYYQLLYGKYPYQGMSDTQILKKIQTTRPDYSGVNISPKVRDFIDRCLNDNPSRRISWRQIYSHPLIKEQEKMIYGLTSKINVKKNQEFYHKDIKIDDPFSGNKIHKKDSLDELVQSDKVDMQKMMKEADEKKQISLSIQKYEKMYLNKRNNIMFIFKFVTPHINNLMAIKANHQITLFILSKKAYHQMRAFHQHVKAKTNFMKLAPHFSEFTKSSKYEALIETTMSDIDLIFAQIYSYQLDIPYCSKEVEKEFDIEQIHNKDWESFVTETITSYEFQLGEGLDRVMGAEKTDLLKVIEALTYYKEHSDNADIENFDRAIEIMDFEMQESKIRSRLECILKGK